MEVPKSWIYPPNLVASCSSSNLLSRIKPKKEDGPMPRFLLNSAFKRASNFSVTRAKWDLEAKPYATAQADCCSPSKRIVNVI